MTGFSAHEIRARTPRLGRRALLAGMAAPVLAAPVLGSALLGSALLAPASATTPKPPPSGRIAFRVMREGKHIGQHELTFTATPDSLKIVLSVDIVVRFGPIALFRYRLTGTESWQGGVMVDAEARTNDDGHDEYMHAVRERSGLWVNGSHNTHQRKERSQTERYRAPDDAHLATHWNIAECTGPWVNPQNGALLRPGFTRHEPEMLHLGRDRSTLARRYDVTGDAQLSLWYDAEDQWTALRFRARDNSLVTYERDS